MHQKKQLNCENLSLRLARQFDEPFLAAVYAEGRRSELNALDWSEEQRAAFFEMQFRLQARAYKMQFPELVCYVVEFDNTRCGRLLVNKSDKEIRFVDIVILSKCRNRGAGTILIGNLQCQAERENKRLNLRVLRENERAIRLYRRLGFEIAEEGQTHLAMQYDPKNKK